MPHRLLEFPAILDSRGALVALEGCKNIPFSIKRVYYIFGVAGGVERGFHAHKELEQVCIALSGSVEFVLDNGKCCESIRLDSPQIGLYISGLTWRQMRNFSADCVLLVLASKHYSERDYIRNYVEFLNFIKGLSCN